MPFKLHPSGYCVWYEDKTRHNLKTGTPCIFCNRIAGHSLTCPAFVYDEERGKSSRVALFDAAAVLWAANSDRSFITFTLPSLEGGTYQRDVDCPETGDIKIAAKFSTVLEAFKVKMKRAGKKLSYVWVSEAQMKRKEKFGGVGDIHYHMVANVKMKDDRDRFIDFELFNWIQSRWCDAVGVYSNNSVDVKPLPDSIDSVPAYLAKYFGKGSQRMILSRRFGCTRDLSRFKPIDLVNAPELDLIVQNEVMTANGYEVVNNYYRTRETLEVYGSAMADQDRWEGSRMDSRFSPDSILKRSIARAVAQAGPTFQEVERLPKWLQKAIRDRHKGSSIST